jgi:hypothetical protein
MRSESIRVTNSQVFPKGTVIYNAKSIAAKTSQTIGRKRASGLINWEANLLVTTNQELKELGMCLDTVFLASGCQMQTKEIGHKRASPNVRPNYYYS